ncbi:hypothetical protein MY8738_001149 [Beauveria namnaoensis]
MPGHACIPLSTGIPPICIASLQDNHGELNRLIQQGSDIEAPNPNTNATAQHLASSLSHGKLVRLLLQPGANYSALLNFLLRAGSRIAVRGRAGATPLHMAAQNGRHVKIVSLPLEVGANVSAVDDDGETRLHVAASHSSGPETLQILLRAGADINALSRDGQTPLLKADGLIDVNARTTENLSPLHVAATKWYIQGVPTLLLDAGADINATSCDGFTPLDFACKEAPTRTSRIGRGGLGLDVVAQEGRVVAVQALLQGGASASLPTKMQGTPEDSARKGKRQHYEALEKEWNAEGMRQGFGDATWAKIREGAAVWDEIIHLFASS